MRQSGEYVLPDPVVGFGAKLAGSAVGWGMRAAFARRALKWDPPEIHSALGLEQDPNRWDGVISAEQGEQVEEFMHDPTVVNLLSWAFVARLAPASDDLLREHPFAEGFLSLAHQWCQERGETWHGLADVLWSEVTKTQETLASNLNDGSAGSDELREDLLQRFTLGHFSRDGQRENIMQLIELAKDPVRQQKLRAVIEECQAVQAGAINRDTFLVQGAEDTAASFDELYIDRQLADAESKTVMKASHVLDLAGARPRAVIIGDPGVGKSTLMSWLRWRLQQHRASGDPSLPVTIICRHLLSTPGTELLAAFRQSFSNLFVRTLSDTEERDLLSVGAVVFIVDGIDEILDPGQRSSVVNQLHALADKYPALSILCTTRRQGFEVQLFKPTAYRLYNLDEYNDTQVELYATKWFERIGDDIRAARFMGESQRLLDLRRNPLMLALLCTLYRQTDYIPRSRRDVYLRCASMMFHEWDPRRGIKIPNVFKSEGEAILREIAHILWTHGGVTGSIDEPQLEQIVTRYLVDKGESSVNAMASARELLEYCSGRAWILSRVGDSAVKRFAFTHRTFFEFFCAEAVVRRINRQNELAGPNNAAAPEDPLGISKLTRQVLTAYQVDPTSVLPELMVQTADDYMDGVAPVVLAELRGAAVNQAVASTSGSLLPLSLRLIASIGVNARSADQIFDAVFDAWSAQHASDLNTLLPLLEIAAGHRERLIERFREDSYLGYNFLCRYARIDHRGEAGLFSEEWADAAHTASQALAERLTFESLSGDLAGQVFDEHALLYAYEAGYLEIEIALRCCPPRSLLEIDLDGAIIPGFLFESVESIEVPARLNIRQEAWQIAGERLAVERMPANVIYGNAFLLHSLGRLPNEGVFPFDVALLLGLLLGPDVAPDLAARLKVAGLREVVAVAYDIRDDLSRKFADNLPDAYWRVEKQKASRSLASAYRGVTGQRPPRLLRDFVGVTDTAKLKWS